MIEKPKDSRELEKNLLGMMFIDREVAKRIVTLCKDVDFYYGTHRNIFNHAKALIEEGKYFDLTILCEKMDWQDSSVVAEIQGLGITDNLFEEYYKRLKEVSVQRRIKGAEYNFDQIAELLKELDITFTSDISVLDRDKVKNYVEDKAENIYSPGWPDFSEHYKLSKGQLTIVAGIPSHGKSSFLDNLAINMVFNHKWKIMFFSPENLPVEKHAFKIMRMIDFADKERGLDWIENNLKFLAPHPDKRTLRNILYSVKDVDLFILDPWNELESARPKTMTETEYIGECLKLIKAHAVMNNMHIIIAAHPTKLTKQENGSYPIPTPYDISGSANWYNKADICFAVYRQHSSGILDNKTEIYIQKVRFHPENGKIGKVKFRYTNYKFEELL